MSHEFAIWHTKLVSMLPILNQTLKEMTTELKYWFYSWRNNSIWYFLWFSKTINCEYTRIYFENRLHNCKSDIVTNNNYERLWISASSRGFYLQFCHFKHVSHLIPSSDFCKTSMCFWFSCPGSRIFTHVILRDSMSIENISAFFVVIYYIL